ncbi:MAG: cell wall-active antibiotics response protein [Clostridia bacterium]|nr:cell wall-active antibiotics response protein [Clostridia bacterium]
MNDNRKAGNIILGIVLVVAGLGFAGNAFNLWDFNLFFEGWWTLFIIIPCAISIISRGPQKGSLIGLMIGIVLLMLARDIIRWNTIGNLIIPFILVVVGLGIILDTRNHKKNRFNNQDDYCEFVDSTTVEGGSTASQGTQEPGKRKDICAIFAGRKITYENENFYGANIDAVFGGVELDLRRAYMNGNIEISLTSVFGGVTIFMPDNVRVIVDSVPIFGGVTNHAVNTVGDVRATIHVNATCMFGGAEIK